jgi:NADH-quinone oxidoreductase subunit K
MGDVMSGEVQRFLAVGAVLFVLGALGFFTRRNLILMILSAELMLHGVSLTLVTFGRMHGTFQGQAFTIFILTVAACEAGLALSLILALYQKSKSLDIDFWTDLREPELTSPRAAELAEQQAFREPPSIYFPRLTPAGRQPDLEHVRDPKLIDDARSQTASSPLEPPVPKEVIKSVTR